MSLLISLVAAQAAALGRTPGEPLRGLQAAITVSAELEHGRPVSLSLDLCNVTQQAVPIDQWVGLWFVDVRDSSNAQVRHLSSGDTVRQVQTPVSLAPGTCWTTALEGLRLVAGAPGSTPYWEYSEPLARDRYSLKAIYRTWSKERYSWYRRITRHRRDRFGKEPTPDWPMPWVGELVSGRAILVVY